MFPLHPSNDLFHPISSPTHRHKIPSDPAASLEPAQTSSALPLPNGKDNKTRRLRQKLPDKDDFDKMMLHRDVERRRRQDMSSLSASLRDLLPLECIKGKRAMSDHMNGAVNYVKFMQKKVKELSVKRDEIKKAIALEKNQNHCAVVTPSCVGIEIMFHSQCYGEVERGFSLSRVLGMLVAEGLNVVCCVSTEGVEGCSIHVIQIEVKDPTCFNISGIQQKLTQVMNSSP